MEAQGLLAAVNTELKHLRDKVLDQLAEVQSESDEVSLTVLDQGNELEVGLNELDRSIDERRCRCDTSRSIGVRMAAVLHMCNNFIITKVCVMMRWKF